MSDPQQNYPAGFRPDLAETLRQRMRPVLAHAASRRQPRPAAATLRRSDNGAFAGVLSILAAKSVVSVIDEDRARLTIDFRDSGEVPRSGLRVSLVALLESDGRRRPYLLLEDVMLGQGLDHASLQGNQGMAIFDFSVLRRLLGVSSKIELRVVPETGGQRGPASVAPGGSARRGEKLTLLALKPVQRHAAHDRQAALLNEQRFELSVANQHGSLVITPAETSGDTGLALAARCEGIATGNLPYLLFELVYRQADNARASTTLFGGDMTELQHLRFEIPVGAQIEELEIYRALP